jgi:hypothetical protein
MTMTRVVALVTTLALLTLATAPSHAADKGPKPIHAPIDSKDLKVLTRSPNIAVAGYRVIFVVRNGIAASADAGDVSSETLVTLAGVDTTHLQAIADKAYANLIEQLAPTGRALVSREAIKASKGFAKLEITEASPEKPYFRKPLADSRTFAVYAPSEFPLWWGHFDAGIGDKAAMALGNWKALNQLSVDTKAVIIVPQLAIDFAALKGSGHSNFSGGASTEAKASLRILEMQTLLRAFHAKIAMAGEGGVGILRKPLPLAASAGKFVSLREWGNQDDVRFANLLASNSSNPNLGPGYSMAGKEIAYVADPAAFEAAVLEGAKHYNAMIASALIAYPAK